MSKQESYHPIFYECLDPEYTSYNLSVPWVCDGWLYACNGPVAVRQPCNKKNTRRKRGDPPFIAVNNLFDGDFNARATKIPPLDSYEDSDAILLRTGYVIRCKYLRLLVKHGAHLDLPKKNFQAARFTIDGGIEGRVMPIRISDGC